MVDVLKEDSCVQYACDMEKTMTESIPEDVKMRIVNGYNRERSGGVAIVLKPNYYAHGMEGIDHGEWNPYDTHIPLVFMGWGIQHGATNRQTDYYGHHGKWKEYLNAAHQNDQFIRQLWECCQQAPFYKGISWAAKGAAEPLVRSWNDIAVEVLDRYQHLIDRQQNRLAI